MGKKICGKIETAIKNKRKYVWWVEEEEIRSTIDFRGGFDSWFGNNTSTFLAGYKSWTEDVLSARVSLLEKQLMRWLTEEEKSKLKKIVDKWERLSKLLEGLGNLEKLKKSNEFLVLK